MSYLMFNMFHNSRNQLTITYRLQRLTKWSKTHLPPTKFKPFPCS